MKKVSGKWKINLSKLSQIINSINQPVNFKVNDTQYQSLELTGGENRLRCYKNIWTKNDSSNIIATISATDSYNAASAAVEWDFGYPIFYGASSLEAIDNSAAQQLSKIIVDGPTFELAKVNIPENNYLYLCIPTDYDNGKLLITINEVFGGVEMLKAEELAIRDYIPKSYNIYRSIQRGLGDLHIVVSERSLGACLFM